jgi:hypothetical protein
VVVLKDTQILYFCTYKYSTDRDENISTSNPEHTIVQVMLLKEEG